MPSKKIRTPVEPGFMYHIYNRGHNYQDVFFQKDDYYLFLNKIKYYLLDYCSLYAYALLPNHYHLLLRIEDNIKKNSFSRQFAKLILSYTNKINLRDNRNGNLFLSCFRRIKIEDQEYLKRLIYYTHKNPLKHGIVNDFRNYRFCSYQAVLSYKPTSISRDEVLYWFGSRDDFIDYHSFLYSEDSIQNLTFEE